MQISAATVSLTVADVSTSSAFLSSHFGFQIEGADPDGNYASLSREDVGMKIIFLRRGCEVLPENQRFQSASGLILAFTTTGLESEIARLESAGVEITLPLMEEPWGEKLFQVTDPNGVVIQLVEWVTPSGGAGDWTG
ncbi:MAG TPA: VOC family protein [Abditibacterium sp.]|jgi:uncharacterized glyoxalase superfamily protein PhnB